ncbi:unnamed protein product [Orchesella dallaii]|uniref:Gustatory receptor n=1 Tax=Orchesella dallaii TaxID=48710 RepID=A0ABP1R0K5_9HEXA
MLTPLQKLSIRLTNTGFPYLPSLPIHWDSNDCQIKLKNKPQAIIPYAFTMSFVAVLALSSCYTVFSHSFLKPRTELHWNAGVFGIVLFMGINTIDAVYWIYVWSSDSTSLLGGINQLVQLKHRICTELGHRENESVLSKVAVTFVAILIPTPCSFILCCFLFDLDPFYFVLEDILPDPMYRSLNVTMLGWLIRIFLMSISACECMRTFALLTTSGVITFINLEQCLNLLISASESLKYSLKRYPMVKIALGMAINHVNKVNSALISLHFWTIITLFWLIIRTVGKTPLMFYLIIVFFACTIPTMVLLYLKLCSDVNAKFEDGITKWKIIAWENLSRKEISQERREARILFLVAKAGKSLPLTYHPFFKIDNDLIVAFFVNIVDRLIDALLVFSV